jgi:hypothetical protein
MLFQGIDFMTNFATMLFWYVIITIFLYLCKTLYYWGRTMIISIVRRYHHFVRTCKKIDRIINNVDNMLEIKNNFIRENIFKDDTNMDCKQDLRFKENWTPKKRLSDKISEMVSNILSSSMLIPWVMLISSSIGYLYQVLNRSRINNMHKEFAKTIRIDDSDIIKNVGKDISHTIRTKPENIERCEKVQENKENIFAQASAQVQEQGQSPTQIPAANPTNNEPGLWSNIIKNITDPSNVQKYIPVMMQLYNSFLMNKCNQGQNELNELRNGDIVHNMTPHQEIIEEYMKFTPTDSPFCNCDKKDIVHNVTPQHDKIEERKDTPIASPLCDCVCDNKNKVCCSFHPFVVPPAQENHENHDIPPSNTSSSITPENNKQPNPYHYLFETQCPCASEMEKIRDEREARDAYKCMINAAYKCI